MLHGAPLAINAGDALMFTALRPLMDALRPLGPDVAEQVMDISMNMARETAEGQALELGWRDPEMSSISPTPTISAWRSRRPPGWA